MELSHTDLRLIAAIQDGLPLVSRPYAEIGQAIGLDETSVIARLRRLIEIGVIHRFGVIVRHRELGYRANAMVVWDVEDERVTEIGRRLAKLPFVTLCYRRPRKLPDWPYNLFCMIHGRDRDVVSRWADEATQDVGLSGRQRAILFSRNRFKQRGARYLAAGDAVPLVGAAQ